MMSVSKNSNKANNIINNIINNKNMNNTKANNRSIINSNNNSNSNSNSNYSNSNNSNSTSTSNKNTSMVDSINNTISENKNYIFAIIGFITFVVVVGGIYYYYYHIRGNKVMVPEKKEILSDEHDGRETLDIPSSDIPLSKYSNEYGISLWLKVDDYKYRYGEEKVILRRGEKGKGSPTILLDTTDNKLIVRTQLQHQTNEDIKEGFTNMKNYDTTEEFGAFGSGTTGISLAKLEEGNLNEKIINNTNGSILSDKTKMPEIEKFISDNSAPLESEQYKGEYFKLISGNNVNSTSENFQDTGATTTTQPAQTTSTPLTEAELVNNMTNFATTLCELTSDIKNKDTSNSLFQGIEALFNMFIEIAELSKTASSHDELTTVLNERISQLETKYNNDQNMINIGRKLQVLESLLSRMETQGQTINIVNLKKTVNDKMKLMGCKFRLMGSTPKELDSNVTIQVLELMKNSVYILIHNLGREIEKEYPELIAQTQTLKDNTDQCVLVKLPMQKWTNIIISQYNQVIDIYIDGKLASSCVLKGFPVMKEEDAVLCPDGGFDGYLSRAAFYNTAITQDMATEIYREGSTYTTGFFNNIPGYVYVIVLFIIIGLIAYSLTL
jgi:hypothetical protein